MAVYTHLSLEDLSEILGHYPIDHVLSFKGIAEGVENSNYFLDTQTGKFILTVFEKRVNVADLPFFMAFMEHLSLKGLPCPKPILNDKHSALSEYKGKTLSILTYLNGVSVHVPSLSHCRAIGESLANMHLSQEDFHGSRNNALNPQGWGRVLDFKAPQELREIHQFSMDCLQTLLPKWPSDLPVGAIHADLFPNNVLFLEDQISGIIDFYFACTDFLSYDLAIVINAWCFSGDSLNTQNLEALLEAYQALRPLTSQEKHALPLLLQGAALRFLATRLYDAVHTPADAVVTKLDPTEYASKLRFWQENPILL